MFWCSRINCSIVLYSSEPSTRSVLMGYTIICHTIGIFTTFFLNTLMPWRTLATICLGMPAITAIAICFVSVQSSSSICSILCSFWNGEFEIMNVNLITDPGDPSMAAIEKTWRRSRKGPLLVTWLGAKINCIQWATITTTTMWTIYILQRMYQTKPKMWPSTANVASEISGIVTISNAQTVYHRNVAVFPGRFFWIIIDATILCANLQSLRKSNFTRSSCGCDELLR